MPHDVSLNDAMLLVILLVALSCCVSAATNPFAGHWQLEMGKEAVCTDQILQLLGFGKIKRDVILSLQVVEQFEVGPATLRIVRDTWYTHSDHTFTLGETQSVEDELLGHVKQTITAQATRIVTAIVRDDRSQISVVRRMEPSNDRFSATMNYTAAAGGQQGSCTRHYAKIHSAHAVGNRMGQLQPLRTEVFASQVRKTRE